MLQPARRQAGFSLLELLVALCVAIILMAVALPMAMRAYRSLQLNNAADSVSDILRQTRSEAIRLNKPVNCVLQPYSGDATMTSAFLTDPSSGNQLTGMGGTTILLGNSGNLVNSTTVPGASALLSQAKLGSVVPTNMAPGGGTVQFDARGAVKQPPGVNAFYLASAVAPEAGYRAVLLMPAGSIEIWSADSSGNWLEQR